MFHTLPPLMVGEIKFGKHFCHNTKYEPELTKFLASKKFIVYILSIYRCIHE